MAFIDRWETRISPARLSIRSKRSDGTRTVKLSSGVDGAAGTGAAAGAEGGGGTLRAGRSNATIGVTGGTSSAITGAAFSGSAASLDADGERSSSSLDCQASKAVRIWSSCFKLWSMVDWSTFSG